MTTNQIKRRYIAFDFIFSTTSNFSSLNLYGNASITLMQTSKQFKKKKSEGSGPKRVRVIDFDHSSAYNATLLVKYMLLTCHLKFVLNLDVVIWILAML